ncbi:MAG: hypothetical protein KC618_00065 [Candidatus Omnitrophica bacterium]|nr:hypothetical protein [Candidatus Omnitrophota bacterium]
MFRSLKNKKAQAVSGEYVLLFFLVIGMMTAMSIYFRRTIQARIYDANGTMFNIVKDRTTGLNIVGNLYTEYEPYYANTQSIVERNTATTEELFQGGGAKVSYDEETIMRTNSVTAPPKDAKQYEEDMLNN